MNTDSNITKPLVSVIITTCNRRPILQRALESVFQQTYKNIEIIVIDDCSTDDTEDFCKRQPVIYHKIGESKGGNHARNEGIRLSKGIWMAFLDDDDWWLPEKIEKCLRVAQVHPDTVVYNLRGFARKNQNWITYESYKAEMTGDISIKALYNGGFTSTSSLFVSKEALLKVGLWDEDLKIWQDNDLIIRLAQNYNFFCLDEYLTIYWIDENDKNKLSNKYYEWKNAVKYLRKKHSAIIKKTNFKEKYLLLNFYLREASGKAKGAGLKRKTYKFILLRCLVNPFIFLNKFAHNNKKSHHSKESNQIN